jgi:hypothetical protein
MSRLRPTWVWVPDGEKPEGEGWTIEDWSWLTEVEAAELARPGLTLWRKIDNAEK